MGRWLWSNIDHDEVFVDEWDVFDIPEDQEFEDE